MGPHPVSRTAQFINYPSKDKKESLGDRDSVIKNAPLANTG